MTNVVLCERFRFDVDSPVAESRSRVFKAWDNQTNRHVAVKEIRTNTGRKCAEFDREMKVYQRLNENDSVARYIDWGKLEDFPDHRYIVLEWCEADLHQTISSGGIHFEGWDDYFERVGASVLDVLVTLHEGNWYHRDLKPGNILLGPNSEPKVIDFGTLKDIGLKEYTMGGWESLPYTPYRRTPLPTGECEAWAWPEFEAYPRGPGVRDCWSFAALSISCLLGEVWTSESARLFDLCDRLAECDLPPGIHTTLHTCLEIDDHSPQNAIELRERLSTAVGDRNLDKVSGTLPLKITQRVRQDVMTEVGLPSPNHARHAVHVDLADGMWFESLKRDETEETLEDHFAIYGEQFRYTCTINREMRDCVVLTSASLARTESLVQVQQNGLRLDLQADFSEGDVSDHREAVLTFKALVLTAIGRRHVTRAEQAYDDTFRVWHQALDFHEELCRRLENKRWEFGRDGQSRHGLVLVVSGEDFLVKQDDTLLLSQGRGFDELPVRVEHVDGDRISVTPIGDGPIPDLDQGELRLDTHGTQKAIARQRYALTRIEDGQAARPDLAELLVGSEDVGELEAAGSPPILAQDLDEDKAVAVAGAMATGDFYMVEGPPGTGKTRLIAEIVWQHLRANPDSRVLISAQTHIALEHALAGVAGLGTEDYILRFRPGRHALADTDAPWSLSSQLDKWKQRALQAGELYLHEFAEAHEVDSSSVKLRIELEKLLLARADARVTLAALSARAAESAERDETLERRRRALNTRIEEACKVAARRLGREWTIRRLQTASDDQIQDLIAELNLTDRASQLARLIALQREWISRFGIDDDFTHALIRQCRVIGATCVGLPALPGIEELVFDVCIIDEAAKATALESVIPMASSLKWIVVGDRRQLPPMTTHGHTAAVLKEEMYLDDETLEATIIDQLGGVLPDTKRIQLTTQHRMVEPLGELISQVFYQGSLIHGKDVSSAPRSWIDASLGARVVWISTSDLPEHSERRRANSPFNPCEIMQVRKLLAELHGAYIAAGAPGVERFSIALLAPYRSQVYELSRQLPTFQGECPQFALSAHTVDSFQGQEARIAVFSVTRSNQDGNLGFVEDARRLNVALSRGMDGLIVVGDSDMVASLSPSSPLNEVLKYVRASNSCVELRPQV